ncbi:Gfo/Idh/MocA family oxidoreductase [Hoeflea sp. G2-23]|uniref:Gfo/Idh/MocA family oxidoreductase n=1 Tax=Hoeflea algicola TaxID=2983763 RepID=A0ABT3ZF22_9HYPH|nr:Gfo/Idh/MocA family oxidoreductase [Hoeflea algicola]MCY0150405.1 Gfo/Idh/MocA family oxidoreductase [Hoeflea algicola]
MPNGLKVLVAGLGHMGMSHAHAYDKLDGYELSALCARSIASRDDLPEQWRDLPRYADFHEALEAVRPDVVAICTYPDTHAEFAISAFKAGAHVFLEKPIAQTVEQAEAVVAAAKQANRKLLVGLSPPHSPMWIKLNSIARGLGKPLVMRMNLNQQSIGPAWNWHQSLMESASPIADCGVHYVDFMCNITGARPVRVHAIGARLSDDIAEDMYNYGQLQVVFDDGSVGWYEAGWGPMMSQSAFIVKDIIGPKGAVSVLSPDNVQPTEAGATVSTSSEISTHSKIRPLRLHHAELGSDNALINSDEDIEIEEVLNHSQMCERKHSYLLDAIRNDRDMTDHMRSAVDSLRIVLAADESIRTEKTVYL